MKLKFKQIAFYLFVLGSIGVASPKIYENIEKLKTSNNLENTLENQKKLNESNLNIAQDEYKVDQIMIQNNEKANQVEPLIVEQSSIEQIILNINTSQKYNIISQSKVIQNFCSNINNVQTSTLNTKKIVNNVTPIISNSTTYSMNAKEELSNSNGADRAGGDLVAAAFVEMAGAFLLDLASLHQLGKILNVSEIKINEAIDTFRIDTSLIKIFDSYGIERDAITEFSTKTITLFRPSWKENSLTMQEKARIVIHEYLRAGGYSNEDDKYALTDEIMRELLKRTNVSYLLTFTHKDSDLRIFLQKIRRYDVSKSNKENYFEYKCDVKASNPNDKNSITEIIFKPIGKEIIATYTMSVNKNSESLTFANGGIANLHSTNKYTNLELILRKGKDAERTITLNLLALGRNNIMYGSMFERKSTNSTITTLQDAPYGQLICQPIDSE